MAQKRMGVLTLLMGLCCGLPVVSGCADASAPPAPMPPQPTAPGPELSPPAASLGWSELVRGASRVSVAADDLGGLVVGGYFDEAVALGDLTLTGGDSRSAMVVRLAPSGAVQWARRFDSSAAGSFYVWSVALAPDGDIVLAGNYRGAIDLGGVEPTPSPDSHSLLVARLDPEGDLRWARAFHPAPHGAFSEPHVRADAHGVVLSGALFGAFDFGGGPLEAQSALDLVVARLDPDGEHVFSDRFITPGAPFTSSPGHVLDGSGDVVLAGCFVGSIDFGQPIVASSDEREAFVAVLGSKGEHRMSRSFPGAKGTCPQAHVDGEEVVLTGDFEGVVDFGDAPLDAGPGKRAFYAARLDQQGEPLTSRLLFSGHAGSQGHVTLDSAGGLVVGGHFQEKLTLGEVELVSAGLEDAFLARFDAAGALVAAKRFGDERSQRITWVHAGAGGLLSVAGAAEGVLDLGHGPLESHGETEQSADAFLGRLSF